MSLNYDSDDAFPRSPGLEQFKPRVTPSPSPPPVVAHQVTISSTAQSVSPPSSRRRKKSNRRKTQPSQGDFVLIRVMDPNRPDIAREVGERALNSDSGSETEDEDMEEPPPRAEAPRPEPVQSQPNSSEGPSSDLQKFAQEALNTNIGSNNLPAITKLPPPFPDHRDSVVEPDIQARDLLNAETGTSPIASTAASSDGVQPAQGGVDARSPTVSASTTQATSPILTAERQGSITNGYANHTSSVTSPTLRDLVIQPRAASPSQKLPALQTPQSPPRDGSASSPSQNHQLPSFRHLSELAETAINAQETQRANHYQHRHSISSVGQSPTSIGRQLSITSLSPGSAFPPLSATSPGASSDIQSRDPFLRSGQSHLSLFSTRRPSQASESGPYSATIHSATTNDSYQSSDGLSPGTQPTPIEARGPRMSIDGALISRTLPPPVGSNIQHIPSHGSGGFRCEYAGCTAPPFQTQYLLNSHANVHSQSRPHYCPIQGCPRAEGGKGFKRKNEMIRHGLVHASPGYVCPFCPDRDHKYPRPDNLQRHVRVHHVDKDKDDPQLREVLSQRPEGGSRGRRRRVS